MSCTIKELKKDLIFAFYEYYNGINVLTFSKNVIIKKSLDYTYHIVFKIPKRLQSYIDNTSLIFVMSKINEWHGNNITYNIEYFDDLTSNTILKGYIDILKSHNIDQYLSNVEYIEGINTIIIESKYCGYLIGRGGRIIDECRDTLGCQFHIMEKSNQPNYIII